MVKQIPMADLNSSDPLDFFFSRLYLWPCVKMKRVVDGVRKPPRSQQIGALEGDCPFSGAIFMDLLGFLSPPATHFSFFSIVGEGTPP